MVIFYLFLRNKFNLNSIQIQSNLNKKFNMKKIPLFSSFLVILLALVAYKKPEISQTQNNNQENKIQEGGTTLAGIYFCAKTKEIIVVEGNDKAVKKIYYAKGKNKLKLQKITSQKKVANAGVIGIDYEASFMGLVADKLSFGELPSGRRYIEQKSKKGAEDTGFSCLSTDLAQFSTSLDTSVLIAKAFSGKYNVENTTDEVEIYTLEMQYSFGFKYKGIDATLLVMEDLSIKMSDPAGKATYSNFEVISFLIEPKGKPSFTLNQKIN